MRWICPLPSEQGKSNTLMLSLFAGITFLYSLHYTICTSSLNSIKNITKISIWINSERPLFLSLPCLSGNECILYHLLCCDSATQSCPTLCNPVDCSMSGFPVLPHLPEFAQTPVHWVDSAVQPAHLPSSPSPHALNLPQHQDHVPKQMPLKNVSMLIMYVYLWKSKSG